MSDQKIVVGAELKLETAQSLESVGKVKAAFKEAQKALHAAQEEFGEFSKEAVKAAKYVAQLKDRIGDAKGLVDNFNPDAKFAAFSNSVNGVLGGFTALQGAMGLIGVEGENVQATLVKVQSAMALSQGVNQVLEARDTFKQFGVVIQNSTLFMKANELATKATAGAMKIFGVATETTAISFKVLKAAIVATGIGLLVIAVAELLPKISAWISGTDDAEAAQKRLNAALEAQQDLLKDELHNIEVFSKMTALRAKLAGKSADEINKIESDAAAEKLDALKKNLNTLEDIAADSRGRSREDQERVQKETNEAQKAWLDEMNKQQIDGLQKQVDVKEKADKESKDKQDRVNQSALAKQKAHEQALIAQRKQYAEEARKLNEELAKENNIGSSGSEENKELTKLEQEFQQKRIVLQRAGASEIELNEWHLRTKAEIEQKYRDEEQKKTLDAFADREAKEKEALQRRQDLHSQSVQAMISATGELVNMEGLSTAQRLQVLTESENSIKDNVAFNEEEKTQLLKGFSDARKQIEEIELQHKYDMASNAGSILSSVSDLAGKQTAAGKGLAVADTTISTYMAAQKAYASQMSTGDPSAPIRAAIAAASALVSGAARLKGILAVKVPGNAGGSASISNPSAPVSPGATNSVTSLDKQSIDRIGNQAIKAYVVESDVTNNQERITRINRQARI
jgi:hypothetical protein